MRRFFIALLTTAVIAAVALPGCSKGPTPSKDVEFSARMTIEEGGSSTDYLVNFTREKQRVEAVVDGHAAGTVIIRLDKGRSWALMPAMKVFLETEVRPENKNPLVYEPDSIIEFERLGDETVDGHPAEKERMVIQNKGGGKVSMYRWFATDMAWPIKAEATDGSWRLYYSDIRLGKQDPALFEPPAGFKLMPKRPLSHAGG